MEDDCMAMSDPCLFRGLFAKRWLAFILYPYLYLHYQLYCSFCSTSM